MTDPSIQPSAFRLRGVHSTSVSMACMAGAISFLLASAAMVLLNGDLKRQIQFSYLVSFMFYLSISLGALFFVMLQHLTGARWSVAVRRPCEVLMMNLPLLAVLFVPIAAWMMPELYLWARPEAVAHDPILQAKAPYLNRPFFVLRAVLYFAVWIGLARLFFGRSVAQDRSGDARITLALRRWSAPGIILFALTTTFAAFDWLMSLEPHWYSTIFGVYYFSGAILGLLAMLILISLALSSPGASGETAITVEHLHDLGKLMFGFLVFWAYIAFSQFLLIWMADLPEETVWYGERWAATPWMIFSLLILVFGHFLAPFLYLLPRTIKRNRLTLGLGAVWLLMMHYLDLYWIVMPAFDHTRVPLHPMDPFLFAGMGCVFMFAVIRRMQRQAYIPVRDPYLAESLAFENF
jgi:hypothetical protein